MELQALRESSEAETLVLVRGNVASLWTKRKNQRRPRVEVPMQEVADIWSWGGGRGEQGRSSSAVKHIRCSHIPIRYSKGTGLVLRKASLSWP